MYVKPTAITQQFFPLLSALPVKINCSKGKHVQQHFLNLRGKFENRGYPHDLSAELTTLTVKLKFIITYHPSVPKLKNWIKEVFKSSN